MHKDKPPSVFDFPRRTTRHAIWFGLAFGAVLSLPAHVAVTLRNDAARDRSQPSLNAADAVDRQFAKFRSKSESPPPQRADVRY